jgi:hypothetical protein
MMSRTDSVPVWRCRSPARPSTTTASQCRSAWERGRGTSPFNRDGIRTRQCDHDGDNATLVMLIMVAMTTCANPRRCDGAGARPGPRPPRHRHAVMVEGAWPGDKHYTPPRGPCTVEVMMMWMMMMMMMVMIIAMMMLMLMMLMIMTIIVETIPGTNRGSVTVPQPGQALDHHGTARPGRSRGRGRDPACPHRHGVRALWR